MSTARTRPVRNSNSDSKEESAMSAPNNVVENENVNQNEEATNVNGDSPNQVENAEPNSEPKVYDNGNIPANFYAGMREQFAAQVKAHNDKVAQIKAAGDRVAITDSLKENPEQTNSPEFVEIAKRRQELSDAYEAAEKAFRESAETFIQEHLKRSGVDKLSAEADELSTSIKATRQYMVAQKASVEDLPEMVSRGGNKSSGTGDGRGSGVPKYRNLRVFVDGKLIQQKVTTSLKDGTKKTEMRSNLTYGAAAANVSPDVFREAFTNAAGSTDASQFKLPAEFKVTDSNNVEHAVIVQRDESAE